MRIIFFFGVLVSSVLYAQSEIIFIHDEEVQAIQEVSNSLSLSKDWAIKFDEELGRGDSMTEKKRIELENNLIEVAEILHIIPKGAVPKTPMIMLDSETHINHNNINHSAKPKERQQPHGERAHNPKFGMYKGV